MSVPNLKRSFNSFKVIRGPKFRVIVVTDPQTLKQTQTQTHAARHRQDRKQYTALLSLARSVIASGIH